MTLHIYGTENIDFSKSEMRQYNRVKDRLSNEFSEDEKEYYLIVDYIIGNKQFDLIFIKNRAITIIDLKSYSGVVKGSENSDWFVKTPENKEIKIKQSKNPFQQLREQRYELIDFINKTLSNTVGRFENESIKNISTVVCFEEGSSYNLSQIESQKHLWFNVISEDEIVKYLKRDNSREFFLRNSEIENLISNLEIKKESDVKKNKIEIDDCVLNNEEIVNITERIFDEYKYDKFNLQDLVELVEPETAVRYLKEAEELNILARSNDKGEFILSNNFKKNLPKDKETNKTDVDISRLSKKDFYMKPESPENGEIYDGVYRGTKYHLNYKKEVWWRRDSMHPKHMADFSSDEVLNKILEIKPQGGSFRITESGEVLTKIYREDKNRYLPIYVCDFDGNIEFDDFDWDPNDPEVGSLWSSIYDGSTFSVNNNRELKIKIGNVQATAIEGHRGLVKRVLKYKRSGGRFKINENGKILTLSYTAPYPKKIQKQIDNLSDEEKNLIDIRKEANIDGMVPIYLGEFSGNIKFKKVFDIHREWTDEDDKEFLERIGVL